MTVTGSLASPQIRRQIRESEPPLGYLDWLETGKRLAQEVPFDALCAARDAARYLIASNAQRGKPMRDSDWELALAMLILYLAPYFVSEPSS